MDDKMFEILSEIKERIAKMETNMSNIEKRVSRIEGIIYGVVGTVLVLLVKQFFGT